MNTLLNNDQLPMFSKFDNKEIEPGIKLILDNLQEKFVELEEKIESEKDINKLYNLAVEETERLEYPLSFGWGMISHLNSVKNNDQLRESYNKIMKYCGYTTDLMRAFDLLLDVAKSNNIKDEDLADLSIFSDMGFDQQLGYNSKILPKVLMDKSQTK